MTAMITRFLAALLALVWAANCRADTAPAPFTPEQRAAIVDIVREALKSDPSILRDAVTALQHDEAVRQEAAARTSIDTHATALTRAPGDPTAGNPDGNVTVVEFYDVRCPYCRRMLPVMAELLHRDPNVKVIYKDIPILGAASVLGAKAVLAAQRQGGYLRMHDALMQGTPDITMETVHAAAQHTGLDWDKLQHDMADPSVQTRIDANLALARTLGIQGTPAYVIGKKMMPGAVDIAELTDAIAAARQQN
jgi:protein-disulfide isomerase